MSTVKLDVPLRDISSAEALAAQSALVAALAAMGGKSLPPRSEPAVGDLVRPVV